MNILSRLVLPNVKALAGGGASAVAFNVLTAINGTCDLEAAGNQLWATLGAYVIGHAVTWLSPANKPA